MAGCCIFQARWLGIVDKDGRQIAGGRTVSFRAPNQGWAVHELARGLAEIFGPESSFLKSELYLKKIEDNPPTRIGEEPLENISPKLRALYAQFLAHASAKTRSR